VGGGDIDDLLRDAQLIGSHVRETGMPDQAKLTQLRESADLILEPGILRPAAVQVVQAGLLDTEAPGAQVQEVAQFARVPALRDGAPV
jgi:hypothetical protein